MSNDDEFVIFPPFESFYIVTLLSCTESALISAEWVSRFLQERAKTPDRFSPQAVLNHLQNIALQGAAITVAAQGFMTAFPDMVVKMDSLNVEGGGRATYHWTLTGTNTGPGGTGKAIQISGYEEWQIADDGLIAKSQGHFDEADYQRQLKTGVGNAR